MCTALATAGLRPEGQLTAHLDDNIADLQQKLAAQQQKAITASGPIVKPRTTNVVFRGIGKTAFDGDDRGITAYSGDRYVASQFGDVESKKIDLGSMTSEELSKAAEEELTSGIVCSLDNPDDCIACGS